MSFEDFICPECQFVLLNPLSRSERILLNPSLLTFESNSDKSISTNKNIFTENEIYSSNDIIEKNKFKFNIPDDYYIFETNDIN